MIVIHSRKNTVSKRESMKLESFAKMFSAFAMAILLFIALFPDAVPGSSAIRWMIFGDFTTEWLVVTGLGIYLSFLIFFRHRSAAHQLWKAQSPDLWLVSVCVIAACAFDYSAGLLPVAAMVLLVTVVTGKGVSAWISCSPNEHHINKANLFLFLLILMLAVGANWHVEAGSHFYYHKTIRRAGPWTNPNIYGLLMASGVVVCVSQIISIWTLYTSKLKKDRGELLLFVIYALAAGTMSIGLLHSYSRGAWLALLCALCFCVYAVQRIDPDRFAFFPRAKSLSIAVVVCSLFVISFWHFQKNQDRVVHRAFSSVDVKDFSWRNRVSAWKGTLQMMAEKPLLGFGWSQPERIYNCYYQPDSVEEPLAIQMNDYLLLGATLGIPALIGFGCYIWFSLYAGLKAVGGEQPMKPDSPEFPCLPLELKTMSVTCYSGAIVLLVGFCFDGALLKIPTGAVFWCLLELGSAARFEHAKS